MRKFGVFAQTIFFAILLAGLYGIIHDQITYSISPEYFTKFKYEQFRFDPTWFGGHRQTVAIIGFLATWWMGLLIGFIIGTVGLSSKDYKIMRRSILSALVIVIVTAIFFGSLGFFWGKYHLTRTGVSWWLPVNLIDKNNFIIVGSIHNFSYLGGIAGLLLAIIFMIRKNILLKTDHEAN